MMMAAGAESPSVATQSAKTDILQKIGQRGNNHQENETALGKIRNETALGKIKNEMLESSDHLAK